MWGATHSSRYAIPCLNYFNPRTHVGCDLAITCTFASVSNFNPRTHVGCDRFNDLTPIGYSISIHAPMWGATELLGKDDTEI